jgi:uncharacterized protein (DUF736 family)
MANETKKIGALWKKTTQSGKKLYTGNVEIDGKKIQIAVFENSYKAENPKAPDLVIYLDTYKAAPRPSGETFPGSPADDDDEIPF